MVIPIVMMFDDNFVIQAGVAIYSLLANANPENNFELCVMHTEITDAHMEKLQSMVAKFPNATLSFMDMRGYDFPDLTIKGTCTKEVVYKLVVPSMFPQYDKIIVTDVDVVFLDDVAPEFLAFTSDEYFAGARGLAIPGAKPFSADITDDNCHFVTGAGYMIYNLAKMRDDDMEQKYIDFAILNMQYLVAPEQEVLNIVSWPNIKLIHPRNMAVVTWWVDLGWEKKYDQNATMEEFAMAKESPVQLHYVSYWPIFKKVWIDPTAPCANYFFEYLAKTPFLVEYFEKYWVEKDSVPTQKKRTPRWRKILAGFVPVRKWRRKIRKG